MNFDAKELWGLEVLRASAATHRDLVTEVKLANDRLPELCAGEKRLGEALGKLSPSQILAFGPDVRAVWQKLQEVSFLRRALSDSKVNYTTRLAKLEAHLDRALQEMSNLLLAKIKDAFYGEDARHWWQQVRYVRGDSPADKADGLIELYRKLGARLSGDSATEPPPATRAAQKS